jgi:hypothetical protein
MMDGADGGIKQGSIEYFLVRTVETDEDFKEKTYYTCVPTTWISKCKQYIPAYAIPVGSVNLSTSVRKIENLSKIIGKVTIEFKCHVATSALMIF